MTNRVELYDAITHLKHLQKRPKGLGSMIRRAYQQGGSEAQVQMGTSSASLEEGILVVNQAGLEEQVEKPHLDSNCPVL